MNQILSPLFPSPVEYPESDGKPMADNSRQFRWIQVISGNLAAQFRVAQDVLVGGNMFWYPVEGHPEIVNAPDVFVVFGRPKGDRGSYKQWEEGHVPMTVVFEVLSPKNTVTEMDEKLLWYEDHGVEEYYVYDPERNWLQIYVRRGDTLTRCRPVESFVSPRLGIRFRLKADDLEVIGPNGQRFVTFEELDEARQREVAAARHTAELAEQRAEQAHARAARLAELSRKARRQQASAEELAELERLEEES
jgi:Uma2 family endonuclease